MARLIRTRDWSKTPLGPVAFWPQAPADGGEHLPREGPVKMQSDAIACGVSIR
jgi:hypothetical protein